MKYISFRHTWNIVQTTKNSSFKCSFIQGMGIFFSVLITDLSTCLTVSSSAVMFMMLAGMHISNNLCTNTVV